MREGDRRLLRDVLVDTGAELSWAPAAVLESLGIARRKSVRFRQADGTTLERWVGFAIIHAGGTFTNDEVVCAGHPGGLGTSCALPPVFEARARSPRAG